LFANAADANDMASVLVDGFTGIALTKETAVGRYPLQTVDMLKSIIRTYEGFQTGDLTTQSYLDNQDKS